MTQQLETEVANLTTSVNEMLDAVNVKKIQLDTSAATATEQAGIATEKAEAAHQSHIAAQAIADALTYPVGINNIGTPGAAGFGVGIAPPEQLPDGMTPLFGYTDPTHPNYGNYQFADGSIMCYVPRFYYRVGHADNPTFAVQGVNSIDIKNSRDFPTRFDAEAAGYALHRAFIDGGSEQAGFFFDKYKASKNALGAGFVASSLNGGDPISAHSAHNPIAELTACTTNAYFQAINAAKGRDGADGVLNAASIFFPTSAPQMTAVGLLSLAHGQAATSATWCAWYHATNNFPKGCNNNALGDANDPEVAYISDGYSNAAKTGSGTPFAKTTHNGQASGIADVNGGMWEINVGITCVATTQNITDITQANPAVVTIAGHGFTTGQVAMILSVGGMTELSSRLFRVTVLDADTFALNGVDSTSFSAYTSGGTVTAGTFYVAKETTAMRDFTSGNSSATDHWGANGVEAMMEPIDPTFRTDHPNNGFALRWGNGAEQVLDADISGDGWRRAGLGIPTVGDALSAGGTNLFGSDYFYQYVRNELCLRSCGAWADAADAGVWSRHWSSHRALASTFVGFRCACYPVS